MDFLYVIMDSKIKVWYNERFKLSDIKPEGDPGYLTSDEGLAMLNMIHPELESFSHIIKSFYDELSNLPPELLNRMDDAKEESDHISPTITTLCGGKILYLNIGNIFKDRVSKTTKLVADYNLKYIDWEGIDGRVWSW